MLQDTKEQVQIAESTPVKTETVDSKQARRKYLKKIEREINGHDGMIEFIAGIALTIWGLYGLCRELGSPQPKGWIVNLVLFSFVIIAIVLDQYQNSYIKKKHPDLNNKDLLRMSLSKDQLIVIPGFIGICIVFGVLLSYEITLPNDLTRNLFLLSILAFPAATALLFIAMKYEIYRLYIWYIYIQIVSLSVLIYPDDWQKFYIKGVAIGVVLVIVSTVVHIRFIQRIKREIAS